MRAARTLQTVCEDSALAQDRRQNARHLTVFRVGKVTRAEGEELCMVRNISSGGAMAHVASPYDLHEDVILDLRLDEQIGATVSWVGERVVGLTFHEPKDLAAVPASPGAKGPRASAPRLKVPAEGRLQVGRDW